MNKNELIVEISKKTKLSQKDIGIVLSAFCEVVGDTLSRQESIRITGFGSFETRERSARLAKNPRTGEAIEVPSHCVPSFKAGKDLKDKVLSKP